jgi:hypothetical protein
VSFIAGLLSTAGHGNRFAAAGVTEEREQPRAAYLDHPAELAGHGVVGAPRSTAG